MTVSVPTMPYRALRRVRSRRRRRTRSVFGSQKKCGAKRFQVVVTTHLNTKHLHCHFVSAPIRGRVNPLSKRQA
ncbi:MAG: relaxase/mobilization nuclease domain-containing protein [Hominenteromicrobium sp.]|uniref:relaxase/mobilization nuclease domain-containing protein n=1 Tax=Hominenteromicrobium sp. TaxID=3073581 RepID=UPI0039A085A9